MKKNTTCFNQFTLLGFPRQLLTDQYLKYESFKHSHKMHNYSTLVITYVYCGSILNTIKNILKYLSY